MTLDKTSATFNKSETLQLNATVSPDDATDTRLNWASSDDSVANVDSLGKVTAVAERKATITVKSMADETKSATVTVTEKTETTPTPAPTYAVTDGNDSTWARGSGKDPTFTFERDIDDDTTLTHFKGVKVDGADVKAENYTARAASTSR